MDQRFEALEEGKRQRIINAAMREFARRGYDHASTNRIVEDAGIAKGLLFHYFKNKQQLFLYLYEHGIGWVTEEVFRHVDFSEPDFFARFRAAQRSKVALIQVYPDIFSFLKSAYLEESAHVKADLEARNRGLLLTTFQKAFEGVDYTVFREGLDVALAVKTIAWAFEGFANAYMETLRHIDVLDMDYERMLVASDEYADFLKQCFYRQNTATLSK